MNKLDKQYTDLLQDILNNGVRKGDRTGTGTISVFGRQIRHKMSEGFPLLTTKKMPFKTIVTELLWFLRGETNIKFLLDYDCHIWDGDAYKNYQKNMTEWFGNESQLTKEEFINKIKTDDEFAKRWGELGPIYGAQWRNWNGRGTDQIQNLINDLKNNPDSRRLMVNAWNVGELDQMVLPPCHYGFQVYTRELSLEEKKKILGLLSEEWETARNNFQNYAMKVTYGEPKDIQYNNEQANHWDSIHKKLAEQIKQIPTRAISLMWNQRSVDTFLGLPFNIASYGLLLEIIAKEVNMVPDELIGNLGDVHLYSNHIEQAREQIGRLYTHEERAELLKQSMGEGNYNKAVDELVPFGGGLSEYYDSYKIPQRTREPKKLPTFDCPAMDEIPYTTFDELVFKLQPADFYMDDYESHPTIKAPLSN